MSSPSTTGLTNQHLIAIAVTLLMIAAAMFFPSQSYIAKNQASALFNGSVAQNIQAASQAIYASYGLGGLGAILLLAGLVRKE